MKLTMTKVLTPLAALAFAFSVHAEQLPANDGFESGSKDATWTFTAGADEAPDASTIVDFVESDAKPENRPDAFAEQENNKYLKLSTEDGILFREFDGGKWVNPGTGLYLDTSVQFTLTDESDRHEASQDDRFILWLESDGNGGTKLCVKGGVYTANANDVIKLDGAGAVYTLSNDNVTIEPGSWHRLTIKAVENIGLSLIEESAYTWPAMPAFQVYVDGYLMKPNRSIFDGEGDNISVDLINSDQIAVELNTFIPSLLQGNLHAVGFSGEGKLDDVVITRTMPNCEPHNTVTFSWDGAKVSSITPYVNGSSAGVFSTSPANFSVPAGATVTLATENIAAATGFNSQFFQFKDTTAEGAEGDVEVTIDGTSKSLSFSFDGVEQQATINIDLDYTLAFNVNIDWSSMQNLLDDIKGIEVSYGTENYQLSGDEIFDPPHALTGVKPGEEIVVNVTYAEDNQYVTVLTADPEGAFEINGTTCTIAAGYEPEGEQNLTILVAAEIQAQKLFQVGENTYTLAELNAAFMNGDLETSERQPVKLLDSVTFESSGIPVGNDTELWIDLNGMTITGPAGKAIFQLESDSGTVTIMDSQAANGQPAGKVVAGERGEIANGYGSLNLRAGDYEGGFSLKGTLYITGGTFTEDVAYTAQFDVGYTLNLDELTKKYVYGLKTYRIVYNPNGAQGSLMADTTFTIKAASTISECTYDAPAGQEFAGWTLTAEGTGTVYIPNDATPEVIETLEAETTLYAKWVDVAVPVEPMNPGQVSEAEYETEQDAIEAAGAVQIAPAATVADAFDRAGLTDEDKASYTEKFEAKVVRQENGHFAVEVALKEAAQAELQQQANSDATTGIAAKLADAATAAQSVELDATPGFYYSIKSGTTLDNMAESATRELATGSKVQLTLPQGGASGFYKVLINVAPKAK